jgi:hypothetical protein
MRPILNQEDFESMTAQAYSVLYFYVDWSTYAVQGRIMLEELESSYGHDDSKPVFCLADVSELESPVAFLGEWLKRQERDGLRMSNVVAAGSGSVAWLSQGEVVDFVQTATHYDLHALRIRTENAFRRAT